MGVVEKRFKPKGHTTKIRAARGQSRRNWYRGFRGEFLQEVMTKLSYVLSSGMA